MQENQWNGWTVTGPWSVTITRNFEFQPMVAPYSGLCLNFLRSLRPLLRLVFVSWPWGSFWFDLWPPRWAACRESEYSTFSRRDNLGLSSLSLFDYFLDLRFMLTSTYTGHVKLGWLALRKRPNLLDPAYRMTPSQTVSPTSRLFVDLNILPVFISWSQLTLRSLSHSPIIQAYCKA